MSNTHTQIHVQMIFAEAVSSINSITGRKNGVGSFFYLYQIPSGAIGNEPLSHFAIPRPNVLRSQFVTLKNLPDLKSQFATAKRNFADLIFNYSLIEMYFNNSISDSLIPAAWN
ncbi:hypothetical protein CLV31_11691 [Algoriphagus aquaeductus]|uniref:Uncharacterized protein n=1 Tax=Algoriphagus aquaeductus TaxID=475299 RepID=A0A326RP09_9BACT|nr:hypothetical protein [Algoriphagus aquaeductus]PZV78662.1 hypothetical protein CLV31_11691 [Algoriphagus aquaeductus]